MISLSTAKKIAIGVGNRMLPYCDRLNIAGSIRRGKLEVKDIEIVCQPKIVKTGQIDLFGADTRKDEVHAEFVSIVNDLGRVVKGKPNGRYMQIELDNPFGGVKKVMLDIFMPQPYDYYRMYAIRTGSSDYSHQVIANAWKRRGWVGTQDGLRLEAECLAVPGVDKKLKYKVIVDNPTLPPAWNSEQEFFEWLGLQYIPPNIRTVLK